MTLSLKEVAEEKAAKPRPDLLPGRALSFVQQVKECQGNRLGVWEVETLAGPHLPYSVEIACVFNDIVVHMGCGYAQALLNIGECMGYGFRKHGMCTWRIADGGQDCPRTHFASLVRHVLEYRANPAAKEEGSGFPVLWHAACQALITLDLMLDPPKELVHAE